MLGPWHVHPDQNLIDDQHHSIHLEPKVMEVLCFLVQRQGEVVSRNELIDEVWRGTYGTDEVLSRAISMLRGALGDDPRNASYIATIPRSGYRLIMPVTPREQTDDPDLPQTTVRPRSSPRLRFSLAALVLGLAALVWVIKPAPPTVDTYAPTVVENLSDWFTSIITGNAAPESITDIAVLPFENISGHSDNAYFSDGLTDEIIGSLSRVPGLKVVARSSSMSFRNRHEDVRAIGDFLRVHAVVEGTVKRVDTRIRVSSQLSSTDDGYVLWSQTYDRDLDDLLLLQDEITLAIVSALQEKLALADALPTVPDTNPPDMAAYQLYLRGRFLGKLRGESPLRESISLYEQALALDPSFTRASLGLANNYILLPTYSDEEQEPMFARALAMVAGLRLSTDAERSDAEAIKGSIAYMRWQWAEAETHLRNALVLAPNNPNLYITYSQLLASTGRRQDALKAALQAKQLDAVSPVVDNLLALAYLWVGDNVRAREQFAIAAEQGYPSQRNPAGLILLMREQRFAEAGLVIENSYANTGMDPRWMKDNIGAIATYTDDEALVIAAEEAMAAGHVLPRFQLGLWLFLDQPEKVYQTVHRFWNQKKILDIMLLFSQEGDRFRASDEFTRLAAETGLDAYRGG